MRKRTLETIWAELAKHRRKLKEKNQPLSRPEADKWRSKEQKLLFEAQNAWYSERKK